MRTSNRWMGALVGVVVFSLSCGMPIDEPESELLSTMNGRLRVVIHDAPIDEVDAVWVVFDEVSVHSEDEGWIVVSNGLQPIELLSLQDDVVAELGLVSLAPGAYNQIRLHVTDSFVEIEGERSEMQIPSGSQSGLKLVHAFVIDSCQELVLSLDWDLGAHLTHNRGQGFQLRPTLHIDSHSGGDICEPEWQPQDPGPEPPSARAELAMAVDTQRGVVVMFGGALGDDKQPGTWEWNDGEWSEIVPVGPGQPSRRSAPAMAFDSRRGLTFLFGGLATGDAHNGETWQWSGSSSSWTQITPTDPENDGNPTPRHVAGIAYDEGSGVAVMFGGSPGRGAVSNETWEFDGVSWALRCDGSPVDDVCTDQPPARTAYGAMAYDTERGVVVLFGGSSSVQFGDTWEWDGDDWTEACVAPDCEAPISRSYHAMSYNNLTETVVLFGGTSGPRHYLNDAWSWNGEIWTSLCDGGPNCSAPSSRSSHAMTYKSGVGHLLFGGYDGTNVLGDTWVLTP